MKIKNYFTHAKIKSFVKAGFFTRNGGVSKKENYSLNCSLNSKDTKVNVNKNIDICLKNLKIKKKIKFISQIHSNKIVEINEKNIDNKYSGDGLVTSNKHIALGVLTADCCPIFIFDKNKKYICALHSGWKGALKNIAAKGIEYFVKQKIIKKNIVVLIGPCLSFKNFEVSKDFNHNPHSSIFDVTQTQVIKGKFSRVLSWYDNEWGFSNRMCDIARYLSKIN